MLRTYQDTIQYLYDRLPMFQRIGSDAFKKDLSNTLALCASLGQPQERFKSIHIAGTNGKGSTSHMLAAALQSAGLKVGLYTSPHLKDFRERIRVNGEMIPEDEVIRFVAEVEPLIEKLSPSFFEVTVAMAFDHFARQKVDVAIIETGLGGRLDSTNIISPIISVITNISYDHTQLLGNTLEEIAGEKAGIIKPYTPVVIGRRQKETEQIFTTTAEALAAPITFSDELKITHQQQTASLLCCTFLPVGKRSMQVCTDLNASYQVENLRTVVAVLLKIQDNKSLSFKLDRALEGLSQTRFTTGLQGRWQLIGSQPLTIADGAHNPDGIAHLLEQVHRRVYNKLHIVFGVVKDKDIEGVLALLPANATYYFTQPNLPRALPAEELYQLAKTAGLSGEIQPAAPDALESAQQLAGKDDLIIITGSLFLVGELV